MVVVLLEGEVEGAYFGWFFELLVVGGFFLIEDFDWDGDFVG